MNKKKIVIIGHGFVGKAVDYGFTHPNIEKVIVDPKYDFKPPYQYDRLEPFRLHEDPSILAYFVCVPTPMGPDGYVDSSLLTQTIKKINQKMEKHQTLGTLVIVKSTAPPDVVKEFGFGQYENVVYNPEFLTEKNANEQFVNPQMMIFGGHPTYVNIASQIYNNFSICEPCNTISCSAEEASFIKYGINTFLATKVTFFNQFYDMIKEYGSTKVNWSNIMRGIGLDERIGTSHTKVPGFDGKQGFGGACFPKDTSALTKFSNQLTLLEKVIKINNEYRSNYELDTREIEQHVNYGQTEEEQQDQDN
jgi:UDPglucose 6-dehydrogenase